jgi:hypothetical protein
MKEGKMANTATTAKGKTLASTTSTTTNAQSVITLSPAIQRQVKTLRSKRDEEKLAKETAGEAREAILAVFGEITANAFGVDARGRKLVAIKVIDSPERIEWDKLSEQDPELYASVRQLLKPYTKAKGESKPTIRVDVL